MFEHITSIEHIQTKSKKKKKEENSNAKQQNYRNFEQLYITGHYIVENTYFLTLDLNWLTEGTFLT